MEFFNDVGADPLKPSLFELVAQEQLRDLLQPALKYVLAVSTFLSISRLLSLILDLDFCPKISEISLAYRKST
jgi:hypothetical protein